MPACISAMPKSPFRLWLQNSKMTDQRKQDREEEPQCLQTYSTKKGCPCKQQPITPKGENTMATDCCRKKSRLSPWWSLLAIIYFIINIRVEAGIATLLERLLDGLVAGVVLLILLYVLARLFRFIEPAADDDLLAWCGACCNDEER